MAERDEEYVSTGLADPPDDLVVGHPLERREGRLEGTRDAEQWMPPPQLLGSGVGETAGAAQEEEACPTGFRHGRKCGHQIVAGNSAWDWMAEEA